MIMIDMEMPETCRECRFHDPDYGFCYATEVGLVVFFVSPRPEWCPLKEVKEKTEDGQKDSV